MTHQPPNMPHLPHLPQRAPLPRDHDAPSFSEVVPLRSKKIKLWRSDILVPGLATVITCVALFLNLFGRTTPQSLLSYYQIFGGYLVFMIFFLFYMYSRIDRPLWVYLFPAVVTALLLERIPLSIFIFVFRKVLPGNIGNGDGAPFIERFIGNFFGAGLMEELLKGVPALIGVVLAIAMRPKFGQPPAQPGFFSRFAIRGPLDGVVMGLAAGAAFIFVETLFEYVPRTISQITASSRNQTLGFLQGFQLLVPRVLQSVAGHMGWAGIFGYFIGLASLYPRRGIIVIVIGWLISSTLHGLWNSVGGVNVYLLYVVAVVTFMLFLACLLKARELHQRRYGGHTGGDSIVISRPLGGPQPAFAGGPGYGPGPGYGQPQGFGPRPPFPPQGGPGGPHPFAGGYPPPGGPGPQGFPPQGFAPQGFAPPGRPPQGGFPPPPQGFPPQGGFAPQPGGFAPQPAASSPPEATRTVPAGPGFLLVMNGQTVRLDPGQKLMLAQMFGITAGPGDFEAEVTTHPQDPSIVGLKNLGQTAWLATAPDGTASSVAPGRNLRLQPGTRVTFGMASGDIRQA